MNPGGDIPVTLQLRKRHMLILKQHKFSQTCRYVNSTLPATRRK